MKHTYTLNGMTCQGCVATITESLLQLEGVEAVELRLERSEATLSLKYTVPLEQLQAALPSKYRIQEQNKAEVEPATATQKSKWVQLRPLFLIFGYLFAASFLLHYPNGNTRAAMLDFMGFFYLVFSFFKLLDVKGFSGSFRMYDPLAKVVPAYGWVYPFLELGLGMLLLLRVALPLALVTTVVVLGITTVGVTQTLLDKRSIRCACLGTALSLPMTEATFIENVIMLGMALWVLGAM